AAIDPPPISLEVRRGNLAQLGAELSKALAIPIAVRAANAADLFNIDARNLPFWEIERLLSRQHPVQFLGNTMGMSLMPGTRWRDSSISRGFVVGFQSFGWRQAAGQLIVQNGGVVQILNGGKLNGVVQINVVNGGVINAQVVAVGGMLVQGNA